MAGGEPRFGTTATYMRRHDHRATCLSIEIDRLHDRLYNEYQVFSAASVRKWSKFGLGAAVRAGRAGSSLADRADGDAGVERGRVELLVSERTRAIMRTFYVIEIESSVERNSVLANDAALSARDTRPGPLF